MSISGGKSSGAKTWDIFRTDASGKEEYMGRVRGKTGLEVSRAYWNETIPEVRDNHSLYTWEARNAFAWGGWKKGERSIVMDPPEQLKKEPVMCYVYVRESNLIAGIRNCKVIPESLVTVDLEKSLVGEGWELVWDSAPSEFDGAKYALNHYRATPA